MLIYLYVSHNATKKDGESITESNVNFFQADYRDGFTYIAKSKYLTGYFSVHLLNRFYVEETAARIITLRLANERVQDMLQVGYINESDFLRAGNEIRYILKILPNLEPFKFLNTDKERLRTEALFQEKSAALLSDYFSRRAELTAMNPAELAVSHEYGLRSDPAQHSGAQLLTDVLSTLRFYAALGEDILTVHEALQRFMDRSEEAARFDESHLAPIAMECFSLTPFPMQTEYSILQQANSKRCTLTRRQYFSRYYSFILTDFFEGLQHGRYPRRCPVCEEYFLMESARKQKYCLGFAPADLTSGKKISCRKYAAMPNSGFQKEKAPDHPIKEMYQRRCSSIRAQMSSGKITREFGELAKRIALEYKERAIRDEGYASTQYEEDMKHNNLFDAVQKRLNG